MTTKPKPKTRRPTVAELEAAQVEPESDEMIDAAYRQASNCPCCGQKPWVGQAWDGGKPLARILCTCGIEISAGMSYGMWGDLLQRWNRRTGR